LGIADFEEGNLEQALAKFESLNPNVSYRVAGTGEAKLPSGDVRNWIAWAHFARGDVRSAVQFLEEVGPKNPDDYAMARLWEGMALSSLGMNDLALRTWDQVSLDVAGRVGPSGEAARMSAQFLIGAISEKNYRTAVSPISGFENDMHFFMGYMASRERDAERAQAHFTKAIDASRGREFPFHLARSKMREE
jgi:tetratricopeptide (TPR) repeat protein